MRARNIKPGFWTNEKIGALEPLCQLLFIGLWCLADRDGILEERPAKIKAEIFPYRDKVDVNRYLTVLERDGFLTRYQVDGITLIMIENFTKHQSPHHTERSKGFPKPTDDRQIKSASCAVTVNEPFNNALNHESGTLNPECGTRTKAGPSDAAKYPADFEELWKEYPKRSGDNPKTRALKAWNARKREGVEPQAMTEGAKRYAAFVRATGKEFTEYVKQAATFLGPDRAFEAPWAVVNAGAPKENLADLQELATAKYLERMKREQAQ